jgi:hypothetical protein
MIELSIDHAIHVPHPTSALTRGSPQAGNGSLAQISHLVRINQMITSPRTGISPPAAESYSDRRSELLPCQLLRP